MGFVEPVSLVSKSTALMLRYSPHNETFQMYLDRSYQLPFKPTGSQQLSRRSLDQHSVTDTDSSTVSSGSPLSKWAQLRWASCTEPLVSSILCCCTHLPSTLFFLECSLKFLPSSTLISCCNHLMFLICLVSLLCSPRLRSSHCMRMSSSWLCSELWS